MNNVLLVLNWPKEAITTAIKLIWNPKYVGETHVTIRNRMTNHRNKATFALNRPIYAHLKEHDSNFSTYSLTIIDQVKDLKARMQLKFYQHHHLQWAVADKQNHLEAARW